MRNFKTVSEYNVVELFESQVMQIPQYTAVHANGTHYTYSSLNEKANQFAHCLKKHNVRAGGYVGVLLEPGIDFILSILAIVKLGAIYLPLDALAPQRRLREILEDAKPDLVITNEKHRHLMTEGKYEIYFVSNRNRESISYSKENPGIPISVLSPLYMMYTSGSTGKPKGVLIPHCAVTHLVKQQNDFQIKAADCIAQFSNLAFDASPFEIWSALLNGANLHVVPSEIRTDPIPFKFFLEKNHIKYLCLPTGFFHQLIKSAVSTLDEVKRIIFGGEQVNSVLLKKFLVYRKEKKLPIELINGYGPTETTAYICRQKISEQHVGCDEQLSSIGTPIDQVRMYLLDEKKQLASEGELYVSGVSLAIGYHNAEAQNQNKFIPNPFCQDEPYQRLYRTGDRIRKLPSGEFLFLGRFDDQVKIGGFRVHLNEVEAQLMRHPAISLAAVKVEMSGDLHQMLVAYLVLSSSQKVGADEIRHFLGEVLPSYMLPAKYVMVDELPLTLIGKVDKSKLDAIPHTDLSFHQDTFSSSVIEEKIKKIWQHLLNRTVIDTQKNLFELGANSLLITEACTKINEELHSELQVMDILSYPSIRKLSRYLEAPQLLGGQQHPRTTQASLIDPEDTFLGRQENESGHLEETNTCDVAIIGMACRFPGANSLEAYWENLCQGKESLQQFDKEQLVDSFKWDNKNFVPVKGILADIDQFDAHFFGFNPDDAQIADPQQRVFLECAWEALEHAAIAPNKLNAKTISVFSGMSDSTYLQENLLKNSWFIKEHDVLQQRIACSTSMLSTLVSYKLNFKGRSINVNTACSTGLITVEQARQDLILGQSDIALAGAVSIIVPQIDGYLYQKGSIVSSDGCCKPFSDEANGTVFSNGVGVVILKRLADALADQDTVYAVIKGCGVSNDGSDKLGFTAPSIRGQMSCIRDALQQAKVKAEDIGYVEAHGTATALGDLVEVNALTSVYREQTKKKQFCFLGSVKANIGHTDVTSGIAGLIKTALCLYHQKILPQIHFEKPNPKLFLNESPFVISTQSVPWLATSTKRYAGVSAFGVGGTNIHMILSECVQKPFFSGDNKEQLIVLSAKTEKALEQNTRNLLHYLANQEKNQAIELANVAHTLQTGREDFPWRRFSVGKTRAELSQTLLKKPMNLCNENIQPHIVFMFPGQGAQYHLMAMELMEKIPLFASIVEQGVNLAKNYLHCDLLAVIRNPDDEHLNQMHYVQPALFIIEYALAQLLIRYGIKPNALIGHNIGECVAACLANVFSFEEGIALVCGGWDVHDKVSLSVPLIPIFSHIRGVWLSEEDATNADYWHRRLGQEVNLWEVMSDSTLRTLCPTPHSFFIEVGPPGQGLSVFLQGMMASQNKKALIIHLLPGSNQKTGEYSQLLHAIGALWQEGVRIDWQGLYKHEKRTRIPLPTYAFQRQKYWVEPDDSSQRFNELMSVYKPVWSHQAAYLDVFPCDRNKLARHSWIIFKDKGGISDQLVCFLQEQGVQPIIIESSSIYDERTSLHFLINLTEKDHYAKVFKRIKKEMHHPVILHVCSCDNVQGTLLEPNQIDQQLDLSFYSIMYLTQAYIEHIGDQMPLKCAVVTGGTQHVVGTETIAPVNASLLGPCRVIPQEHKLLKFRLLDINIEELSFYNQPLLSHIIHACIKDEWDNQYPLITYRNGYCWDVAYTEIKSTEKRTRFKDQGVYLLTGGMGDIALNLCEVIARKVVNPRFILLSRSPVIMESEWNKILCDASHAFHQKVKYFKKLQELGAILFFHQTDVSHLESIVSLINFYKEYLGTIDGVIHAAGIAGNGLVQLKSKNKMHDVLLPKIHGTYHLAQALQGLSLDFVALMSSMMVLTGNKGQVDYCAANACLDAFATTHLFPAQFVVSINWNTWRDQGMAVEMQRLDEMNYFEGGNDLSPLQGQQLFLQVMEHNSPNTVISNDEPERYAFMLKQKRDKIKLPHVKMTRQDMNMRNQYQAPNNAIEEKLVQIWQDNLGIEIVGVCDDFFALGGHSLKALNLVEKINKIFVSSITIQHLYQAPTIAQLSELIRVAVDNKQTDSVIPSNLEQILD